PFDLAALPIGAYVPAVIMRASHTTPEEALQAFADVRGQRFVPIHWGTFDLAEEPLEEPPRRLVTEATRLNLDLDRIWVLRHGQTRAWSPAGGRQGGGGAGPAPADLGAST